MNVEHLEECAASELSTSTPSWLLRHILREFFVLFVKAAFSYSYRLCSICHYRGGRNHLCADVTVANEWPSCSLRVCTVSVFGDRDPAVRLCHGLHKSHVKNSNNWLGCTTGGKQMWTVCGGFWTRLTSMLSFTFPLAAAHRLTWEIGRSSHITHWIPVRSASIHYSLLWSLKTLKLLKVLWPLIDHFFIYQEYSNLHSLHTFYHYFKTIYVSFYCG